MYFLEEYLEVLHVGDSTGALETCLSIPQTDVSPTSEALTFIKISFFLGAPFAPQTILIVWKLNITLTPSQTYELPFRSDCERTTSF